MDKELAGPTVFASLLDQQAALQAHTRLAVSPGCRSKVYHPLEHRTYAPAYPETAFLNGEERDWPDLHRRRTTFAGTTRDSGADADALSSGQRASRPTAS